jgi:hypothetical protein
MQVVVKICILVLDPGVLISNESRLTKRVSINSVYLPGISRSCIEEGSETGHRSMHWKRRDSKIISSTLARPSALFGS